MATTRQVGNLKGRSDSNCSLWIVGMTVSSDSLAAMGEFFKNMPSDSGIAFVVKQEPSPDFMGLIREQLERCSSLVFVDVIHDVEVLPNRIYLAPVNRQVLFTGSRLLLVHQDFNDSECAPIDSFFESLAINAQAAAIAVVLSHAELNCVQGLKKIRATGGLVVVQDTTESSDKTPRVGLVDLIVSPEKMPAKLCRHVQREAQTEKALSGNNAELSVSQDSLAEELLSKIYEILLARCFVDFSHFKSSLFERRLQRRLNLTKSEGLQAYVRLLIEDHAESEALGGDMLFDSTGFFRNAQAFERLETDVFPRIFSAAESHDSIRCWVPACGTGEEAFSIAMLLLEANEQHGREMKIRIFATDAKSSSLEIARKGLYSTDGAMEIPARLRNKYFTCSGNVFEANSVLRQSVLFTRHDVTTDPPLTKMDIVSCRNLLIYLNPESQRQLLERLQYSLKDRGLLFLGACESMYEMAADFETIDSDWRIYRKSGTGPFSYQEREWAENKFNSSRIRNRQSTFRDRKFGCPDDDTRDRQGLVEVLQSTTEELAMVESEHQRLALELARLKSDMDIMLHGVESGIVILDEHLCLRYVSPGMTKDFGVSSFDLGRPFSQIECHLNCIGLTEDIRKAVESRTSNEREVVSRDGAKVFRIRVCLGSEKSKEFNGAMILCNEITVQKRAKEQIQETENLRRGHRDLQEFAYAVSHDLKAPVRQVLQCAELIDLTHAEEVGGEYSQWVSVIAEKTQRLDTMLECLLEYSRVNTRGGSFATFKGTSLIRHAISSLSDEIEKSNATITYDILPTLVGDERQLKIVLRSLIDNAIKYCAVPKPRIHVAVECRQGQWQFSVTDNGVGIESQHQSKIFVMFRRLGFVENVSGNGLGLALVKRIVERHHGRLWVESEYGKGSTFFFTLPDEMATSVDDLLVSTNIQTVLLDRELRILRFTGGSAETFDFVPQDLGRRIHSLNLDMFDRDLLSKIERVLETETPFEKEVRGPSDRWFLLRVLPYLSSGNVEGAVLTLVDITTLKSAQRKLAQVSEIVEHSDDAILRISTEGVITTWNVGAAKLFQYEWDEIVGANAAVLIPEEHQGIFQAALAEAVSSGVVNRLETRGVRKAGDQIDISVTLSPIFDENQRVVGVSEILRDVTAQKNAENEVQTSIRHRDQFLAMLSHELRNPMAAILNATTLLSENGLEQDTEDAAKQIIERHVQHVAHLLDDLVDVSLITHDKIRLKQEVFDLRSMMPHVVECVQAQMDDRNQKLCVEPYSEPLMVRGDAGRLQQAQINLLVNATKYTGRDGVIEYVVMRDEENAVIQVRDNGVGISAESIKYIFDPFHQTEQTLDRSQGGMGLGLPLAQMVIEAHGGSLQAFSQGVNRGSTFTIRLPLTRQLTCHTSAPCRGAERSLHFEGGGTMVIVEDNEGIRKMLEAAMKLKGFDVTSAADGWRGLDAIVDVNPDVALVDIGLPGMTGYELATQVRAKPTLDHVSLIAVSGYGGDEDRVKAVESGFDRHLLKPVGPNELLEVIKTLTAERSSKRLEEDSSTVPSLDF